MPRRLLALVAAVALTAAACGDSSEVDPEADQAAADEAVAAFTELVEGEGFEATPDDDDENEIVFESPDCRKFSEAFPEDDEELPGETASAETADFERGDADDPTSAQETLQGSVGFVDDEAALDDLFALYRDDRLSPCLEEAFRVAFEQDSSAGGFAVEDLAFEETESPGVGDDSLAFEVTGSLATSIGAFPFAFEFAIARADRIAALVTVGAVGGEGASEIDSAELLRLLVEEAEEAA